MIKKIAIFPHPPVVIPEIGKNGWQLVRKTFSAMEAVGKEFFEDGVKKLLVISPHGPAYSRIIVVNNDNPLQGDLGDFDYNKKYSFSNNLEFVNALVENGFHGMRARLDHGALVPLYFLDREMAEIEIISISTGFMTFEDIKEKGNVVADLLNTDKRFRDEKYGIIVSADLSHRLKIDSYYGFAEEGPIFDKLIFDSVAESNLEKISKIPKEIVEGAGQCGFIPLVLLSEIVKDLEFNFQVLNYEHPFGVGYLVGKGELING